MLHVSIYEFPKKIQMENANRFVSYRHKGYYKTFQKITFALMKDLKLIFISGMYAKSQVLW